MWIEEDGRLATAAIPVDTALAIDSVQRWISSNPRALEDFDPWRPGGVADSITDELRLDPDTRGGGRESDHVGEPIPESVLASFPWEETIDVDSAERALRQVPVRWRLDVAHVIEDLLVAMDGEQ